MSFVLTLCSLSPCPSPSPDRSFLMTRQPAQFMESTSLTCEIPHRGIIVAKVLEYLSFKVQYKDATTKDYVPDFADRIEPEIALEVLMAADYLEGELSNFFSLFLERVGRVKRWGEGRGGGEMSCRCEGLAGLTPSYSSFFLWILFSYSMIDPRLPSTRMPLKKHTLRKNHVNDTLTTSPLPTRTPTT